MIITVSLTKEAADAIRRLMVRPGPYPPVDPDDEARVLIELQPSTLARLAIHANEGEGLSETIVRLCSTVPSLDPEYKPN